MSLIWNEILCYTSSLTKKEVLLEGHSFFGPGKLDALIRFESWVLVHSAVAPARVFEQPHYALAEGTFGVEH